VRIRGPSRASPRLRGRCAQAAIYVQCSFKLTTGERQGDRNFSYGGSPLGLAVQHTACASCAFSPRSVLPRGMQDDDVPSVTLPEGGLGQLIGQVSALATPRLP
jgi:hypothetical protein